MSTRREAALIRLGDLRVRQGRLEDAAQLLKGFEAHPDAVRALAGLYLARAETALARSVLERATAGPDDVVPGGRRVQDDRPVARAARRCPPRGGRPRCRCTGCRASAPLRRRGGQRLPASRRLARGGSGVHREREGRCVCLPARCPGRLRPGTDADGARMHALGDGALACRRALPRSPSPRRSWHWKASSHSRQHGTRTLLPDAAIARWAGSHRTEGSRRARPSGRPRCSSSSARGCRIPR